LLPKRAAALCPLGLVPELGELLGEPERPHDVAARRGNARCPHYRGNAGEDTLNLIGVDPDVAGSADVKQIRDRWASTATSAAMRTSMSVSSSRVEASIDSVVTDPETGAG
jgi:hypothetical protein